MSEQDTGPGRTVVAFRPDLTDIPFLTLCSHHLLPLHAQAHVAYLPGERIIGISKLARVVEMFARDLRRRQELFSLVG